MENQNLAKVVSNYSTVARECPIGQFGPPFAYYHADDIDSNILATNLIEVDVKAAFPTICKFTFGENHPFVKQIFAIEDKLKRNIFISTTLTDQTKKDGKLYLNDLNIWSKILVFGYIYTKYKNINILEYAKDGALFKGEPNDNLTKDNVDFLKFINDNNVIYHEKIVPIYIRVNRTSIFSNNDDKIKIKGIYHNLPKFIQNNILRKFLDGDIFNQQLLSDIKKVYSTSYYKILYKSNAFDLIKNYYEFDKTYLDHNGRLNSLDHIDVKSYLIYIIYPVLSLLRLKIKH